MKITPKIAAATFSVLLVTGCASPAPRLPQAVTSRPVTIEREARTLTHWQNRGVLSVTTVHGTMTAHWQWQQDGPRYKLMLAGPFNSGAVRITGQPGRVILELENGDRLSAATPDQLLARATGWPLPVSLLHAWIRGLPAQGLSTHATRDAQQQLTVLTQNGWTVHFPTYTHAGGFALPAKVIITGKGIQIRIIVRDWRIS